MGNIKDMSSAYKTDGLKLNNTQNRERLKLEKGKREKKRSL